MNHRVLGRTGIQISEIAFGCVEIGIPYGIGVNGIRDMPSEAESIKMLYAALDKGINFFDTARLYGRSEAIIGKAFGAKRKDVVICTKCTHLSKSDEALADSNALKSAIVDSLQDSLSALQTDYVDLYMLHNADPVILDNETVMNAFSGLRREGVVRSIGVSTYTVGETEKAIEHGIWDAIQLPFNLMDQRQLTLFEKARMADIGLVVRSVLLKGILSDKGRDLHPALKSVEEHRRQYNKLMSENNASLSELATKFALSFSEISSVLVGIDRMAYLGNAVKAADGRYMDVDTLERAKQLAYPVPEFLDLPEWDRKGWLK